MLGIVQYYLYFMQTWQSNSQQQQVTTPQKQEKPATAWEAAYEQHLQQRQQPVTGTHEQHKRTQRSSQPVATVATVDKHVAQSAGNFSFLLLFCR